MALLTHPHVNSEVFIVKTLEKENVWDETHEGLQRAVLRFDVC